MFTFGETSALVSTLIVLFFQVRKYILLFMLLGEREAIYLLFSNGFRLHEYDNTVSYKQ